MTIKNNIVSLALVVLLITLGGIIAGNIFVDQGSLEISENLNASGNLSSGNFYTDLTNVFIGDLPPEGYSGDDGVHIGRGTGQNLETGERNILIGYLAGNSLEGGSGNSFLGYASGTHGVGSSDNVGLGRGTLNENIDGDNNVAIGYSAAGLGSSVNAGIYIGDRAGENINSTMNTFIGRMSGRYLRNNCFRNVLIGNVAGYGSLGSLTDDAIYNTIIGESAGFNLSGDNNVFIGRTSGYNAGGSSNVFIGYRSGFNEQGSNILYIENSDLSTPLIYGEFDNDWLQFNGDVNITGDTFVQKIYAKNYSDYTPAWTGSSEDALNAVARIENHGSEIDHSSYPDFAQSQIPIYEYVETGEECEMVETLEGSEEVCRPVVEKRVKEYIEGRNLGATVTLLVESVKALEARLDEVCAKDTSYSFC